MQEFDQNPRFGFRWRALLRIENVRHRFTVMEKLQVQIWQAYFERHAVGKLAGHECGVRCAKLEVGAPLGNAARYIAVRDARQPLHQIDRFAAGAREFGKIIAGKISHFYHAGSAVPIRRICHSGCL